MPTVIHHNPDCGTSRNTLAILEAAGYRPIVVEYLKNIDPNFTQYYRSHEIPEESHLVNP